MNGANQIQRLSAGILVAICVMLVVLLGLALKDNHDNQEQTRAITFGLRASQYETCETSLNALREQVRDEFVSLKTKVLIPVFSGVAATLPPGDPVRDLLRHEVAYLGERIDTIKQRIPDADCAELFPPLAGQRYPEAAR